MMVEDESMIKTSKDLKDSFGRQEQKLSDVEAQFIEVDIFKQTIRTDISKIQETLEGLRDAIEQISQSQSAIVAAIRNNQINIDGLTGAINNSSGEGSIIVNHNADNSLTIVGTDSEFSGTAYFNGKRTTGLDGTAAYPWVKINCSTGEWSEELGPPSDAWGDKEEWFEKSKTFGDIHVTRL